MKHKKITVSLFLFTATLYALGGLRDIFAPGFFNISPAVPTTADIVLKFTLAFVFLVVGVSISMAGSQDQKSKD